MHIKRLQIVYNISNFYMFQRLGASCEESKVQSFEVPKQQD